MRAPHAPIFAQNRFIGRIVELSRVVFWNILGLNDISFSNFWLQTTTLPQQTHFRKRARLEDSNFNNSAHSSFSQLFDFIIWNVWLFSERCWSYNVCSVQFRISTIQTFPVFMPFNLSLCLPALFWFFFFYFSVLFLSTPLCLFVVTITINRAKVLFFECADSSIL